MVGKDRSKHSPYEAKISDESKVEISYGMLKALCHDAGWDWEEFTGMNSNEVRVYNRVYGNDFKINEGQIGFVYEKQRAESTPLTTVAKTGTVIQHRKYGTQGVIRGSYVGGFIVEPHIKKSVDELLQLPFEKVEQWDVICVPGS